MESFTGAMFAKRRALFLGWLVLAIAVCGCADDDANLDAGGGVVPGDGDGDSAIEERDAAPDADADADVSEEDGGARCEDDRDCDNGLVCDGHERCEAGHCVNGAPPSECTSDHPCTEETRGCDCRNPSLDGDRYKAKACGGDDCDDSRGDIHPGAAEICDVGGVDEDCVPTTFNGEDGDADGDGFVSALCFNIGPDGRHEGKDCRDNNPTIHPGATEACDYEDNDCNGVVDERPGPNGEKTRVAGGLHENFYPDLDEDGCGDMDEAKIVRGCGLSDFVDYVRGEDACDCDDEDPDVSQRAEEICDGKDNDCDALVDDADVNVNESSLIEEFHFTDTELECVDGDWAITSCPEGRLWCTDVVDFGCTTDSTQLHSCGACETDCKFACGDGCDEVVGLAAGLNMSCAVTSQGRAACWGRGGQGRLGTDSIRTELQPTELAGIRDVTAIAARQSFGCAIAGELDELYCWGDNGSGQVANGEAEDEPYSAVPLPLASPFDDEVTLSHVRSVSPALEHGCATRESGELLCWGRDAPGRLANGGSGGEPQFPRVAYDSSFSEIDYATSVACGDEHSCFITADKTVQCFGTNAFGQLGNRDIIDFTDVSAEVAGLTSVEQISAGAFHTCVLANGDVLCWGLNNRLQLGRASTQDDDLPAVVDGLPEIAAIAAGTQFTCALDTEGRVHCWGANDRGQRGDLVPEDSATPSMVDLSNVVALSAGSDHACALTVSGRAYCWGANFYGQLGNGRSTQAPQAMPSPIEPLQRTGSN